jgi:molecular chaperone GrpE (heat shock protein)
VARVTDKDTDPAGAADPGEMDVCAETAAEAAGDTGAAPGELADRLGRVEEQLAEFHRRSAHRELVIDRLHGENQQLRGGIGKIILEPVVADLIRLDDQLNREVRRLESDGQDPRLLWSFAEDVRQILDRCGIDVFSAEPGDPFDRDRHRPLAVVACQDQSLHNTVAEVVAAGFAERETGRVRRPVQARFYQYTPGSGEPEPDSDAAQSQ